MHILFVRERKRMSKKKNMSFVEKNAAWSKHSEKEEREQDTFSCWTRQTQRIKKYYEWNTILHNSSCIAPGKKGEKRYRYCHHKKLLPLRHQSIYERQLSKWLHSFALYPRKYNDMRGKISGKKSIPLRCELYAMSRYLPLSSGYCGTPPVGILWMEGLLFVPS